MRRDRPELRDVREEIVDRAPPFIRFAAVLPEVHPVQPQGVHGLCAALFQVIEQSVGAGRLVADEGSEKKTLEKVGQRLEIVRLAGEDLETHKVSERIRNGRGPACQAASRTTGPMSRGPAFAPDAFW